MKVRALAIQPPAGGPRPGLHQSDIIKWRLMKRDAKRYGGQPTVADRWGWELGLAWEEHALRLFQCPCGQPWERQVASERDGILQTVDALCRQCRLIAECKLTDLSSAHDFKTAPEFWGHRQQVLGYMRTWGWSRAWLPIFHLQGDYRAERKVVRLLEVRASKLDLDRNWRQLLDAREDMEDERARLSAASA